LYTTFCHHPLLTYSLDDNRHLHSFPARRSSDLSNRRRSSRALRARPRRREGCGMRLYLVQSLDSGGFLVPDDGYVGWTRSLRHADRKSTRLNSSHVKISYAVFCLKRKSNHTTVS